MKFFNLKKIINPRHHEGEEKSEETLFAAPLRKGLVFLGAWPGITAKYGFYALIISCGVCFIFEMWDAYIVIDDIDKLAENLEVTMGVIATTVKITSLRLKHRSIKFAVQDVSNLWAYTTRESTRKIMLENADLAKNIFNIYIVSYFGLESLYLSTPLVSYNAESVEDRRFILPSTFPISNSKQSPIYEAITVYHAIVLSGVTYGYMLVDGLLITLVLHAQTKVYDLSQDIFKFSTICQKNYDTRVKLQTAEILINKHVNYIEYTEYLQDIFSMVSLTAALMTILMIAFVGFFFVYLLENNAPYTRILMGFLYIICVLMSLACYCGAGEYLKAQSYKILDNLVNCPWHEFQSTDMKIFLFMIMKAQKPVTITVGKFDDLSLIYFTKVIKTSFSYFSLLRAVKS